MNKSAPKIEYVLVPRDVVISCKACCENWLHAREPDPLEKRLLIRSIDILRRALEQPKESTV